jgi:hypothetical protein
MGAQRTGQLSPLLRLQALRRKANKRIYHADGWLEVLANKDIDPDDEVPAKKRRNPVRNPLRVDYLHRTIKLLHDFGEVVLVRLPAGENYWEDEAAVYPGFDEEMEGIALKYDIPYFNFLKADYVFHDARQHHLGSEGARAFSADLAIAIRDWQRNN